MRKLWFRCAPLGLWGFTSTVRPAFGNLPAFHGLRWLCEGPGHIKTEVFPLDCVRYHGCLYEPMFGMPFHITQQGISPPEHGWEVCLFSIYALQQAGLLRIPSPGLQAERLVLGLLSAVGEWLFIFMLPLFMCLLPHTVITLRSPLWLLCCCLPWTQCSSSYSIDWCTIIMLCVTAKA